MNNDYTGKMTGFNCTDSEGNLYRWYFYRDARRPSAWYLKDHEGYVRILENTWIDSVAKIKRIVQNYGFTSSID